MRLARLLWPAGLSVDVYDDVHAHVYYMCMYPYMHPPRLARSLAGPPSQPRGKKGALGPGPPGYYYYYYDCHDNYEIIIIIIIINISLPFSEQNGAVALRPRMRRGVMGFPKRAADETY